MSNASVTRSHSYQQIHQEEQSPPPRRPRVPRMKKRSLSGQIGVGVFVVALVTVVVAFCAPAWLVSDHRITGAKLERLGLWSHCFRSLAPPGDEYLRRFFVGCRWVYDPFTTGYDEIRGFLLPPFMIATQFFYTLCFLAVVISMILVLLLVLCCGPDQRKFVLLLWTLAGLLLFAGVCGTLGVIIFACLGNADGWMPEHANNFLGWAFGLGVVGAVTSLISGALFLTEANVQKKKRQEFKESQARFELQQHESKA